MPGDELWTARGARSQDVGDGWPWHVSLGLHKLMFIVDIILFLLFRLFFVLYDYWA